MDLGISGRNAIVAGSSAGLGLACARALGAEGANLYISARGKDRLLAAARALEDGTGASVTPVVADHGTAAGRAELLAACPRPDILVITCSPPPLVRSYLDVEPQQWTQSWSVAFLGPVELIRATTPGMIERRFGRIVNIATLGAKYPLEERLLSGATRAALANYSVAVGRALVRHNVTINNLLPGIYDTPGLASLLGDRQVTTGPGPDALASSPIGGTLPANRSGHPDELATLCVVLRSDRAGYTVGQSVAVDGGLSRSTF
jgi:3-oxoacyl-[acyl-carrier protein] reductase